jgi:membrane associated rhomboid family serine protease
MQSDRFMMKNSDHDGDEFRIVATGPPEHLAICSLVLNAVGIPHFIDPSQAGLSVPADSAAAAKYHIEQYFEENTGWPEPPPSFPAQPRAGNPPTLAAVGGLVLFYLVTGPWNVQTPWFKNGAIDSQAILEQGEWWRLITALTLHADLLHLVGNCLIGGILVHLLCRTVGSGLGWTLLIVSGALGNYLNIALRDSVHYSVGFSTSIFAAIGIFSGLQISAGRSFNVKKLLIPLGAGAGLLALLGVEGERTDLGAHFFGFLCGIAMGILVTKTGLLRRAAAAAFQQKLYILALSLVGICWVLAWQQ